jgi:hypothetical protein
MTRYLQLSSPGACRPDRQYVYHPQAINKLLPVFQKFSMKQQLEVMVVDLKPDILCSFSAEANVSQIKCLEGTGILLCTTCRS